eukprot:TRINITY_DN11148_c0_g1_i2.p2 TRINITY_DN11148_c0_g1~~TRINITY_DN11148_c0_g1_i2.p2  ORF type:complete len:101 (+),score=10.53 TRINITY_DN11148_c0_g1_i2:107-409(+)
MYQGVPQGREMTIEGEFLPNISSLILWKNNTTMLAEIGIVFVITRVCVRRYREDARGMLLIGTPVDVLQLIVFNNKKKIHIIVIINIKKEGRNRTNHNKK